MLFTTALLKSNQIQNAQFCPRFHQSIKGQRPRVLHDSALIFVSDAVPLFVIGQRTIAGHKGSGDLS